MIQEVPSVLPVPGQAPRYGVDPILDAWLLHFMTENNLEHSIDPEKNASPEQLRFMVSLAPEEIYVPCSDEMFSHLISERADPLVVAEYDSRLARIGRLIDANPHAPRSGLLPAGIKIAVPLIERPAATVHAGLPPWKR